MGLTLKIHTEANSAFAYKVASLIDDLLKDDRGVIPEDNSAAWYEHLVSSDADGKVNAEAFVLVITPSELSEEGLGKWEAVSHSVRNLLNDGNETRSVMRGQAVGYPKHSESKVSFIPE